jgi:hypothetical protein
MWLSCSYFPSLPSRSSLVSSYWVLLVSLPSWKEQLRGDSLAKRPFMLIFQLFVLNSSSIFAGSRSSSSSFYSFRKALSLPSKWCEDPHSGVA